MTENIEPQRSLAEVRLEIAQKVERWEAEHVPPVLRKRRDSYVWLAGNPGSEKDVKREEGSSGRLGARVWYALLGPERSHARAIAVCDDALAGRRDDVPEHELRVIRAIALLDAGRFAEALADCDHIIAEIALYDGFAARQAERERRKAFLVRAIILMAQGRFDESSEACEKAEDLMKTEADWSGFCAIAQVKGWLCQELLATKLKAESIVEAGVSGYNPKIMDDAAFDLNAAADELGLSKRKAFEALKREAKAELASRATTGRAKAKPRPKNDLKAKLDRLEAKAVKLGDGTLLSLIARYKVQRNVTLPPDGVRITDPEQAKAAAGLPATFKNLQARLTEHGLKPLPPDALVAKAKRQSMAFYRNRKVAAIEAA
jgi:tetratricopeptide (TPR) repeat protein